MIAVDSPPKQVFIYPAQVPQTPLPLVEKIPGTTPGLLLGFDPELGDSPRDQHFSPQPALASWTALLATRTSVKVYEIRRCLFL